MERPRQARPEESDDLVDLISTVFRFDYYRRDYMLTGMRRPLMQTGRVIVEEGKPVSYIFAHDTAFRMYGCTTNISSIGCVCTREDQRNKGLASAILTHHIERLAGAGVRLMVVSGGRGLYRRNQCVPAGPAYEAKFTPDALPAAPPDLSVRRVTLDDWPTLAPFYQAEPAHFVRPADLEQSLCFWWNCYGTEIYLVESDGCPVAYAALTIHRGRDEHGRRVVEYAGSRAALLDGLPLLFQATDAPLIIFAALAQDADLRYRFSRLGLAITWRTISGTIRLIDLPGLMDDLQGYLAERLPERDLAHLSFSQGGGNCTFSLGEETLTLDLAAAARLVCGGPDAPQVPGALGRVLSAIFPLPTIQPGLNYV